MKQADCFAVRQFFLKNSVFYYKYIACALAYGKNGVYITSAKMENYCLLKGKI